MQTHARPMPKPAVMADRRATAAERRADRAETKVTMTLREADCLAAELAEMRQDRDRWRAQAERVAAALDRLKAPNVVQAAVPPVITPIGADAAAGANDLLMGVPAIAAAFRWNVWQAYYLKERHGLPTFKIGRIVCASRRAVAAWIAAKGAAALSDAQGEC